MTRALTDPHIVRKIIEKRRRHPPLRRANYCLDRIYQGGAACTQCCHRPRADHTACDCKGRHPARSLSGLGLPDWKLPVSLLNAAMPSSCLAAPHAVARSAYCQATAQGNDRYHRLAACQSAGRNLPLQQLGGSANDRRGKSDVSSSPLAGCAYRVLTSGNDLVVSAWDIISGDGSRGPMCWSSTMPATIPAFRRQKCWQGRCAG